MGGKFLLKQYNNFPKGVEWELFPQFETHIVFQYNTLKQAFILTQ